MEATENRQRRNNIRVVGLPEDAEGPQPAIFAERFFMKLLEMPVMPSTYEGEWVHRVPMWNRPSGTPPRAFLVRFLNFRDGDNILVEGRKREALIFEKNLRK